MTQTAHAHAAARLAQQVSPDPARSLWLNRARDLSALLLNVSRAEMTERIHISVCRQRARGADCAACADYETAWLTADCALTAFLTRMARLALKQLSVGAS